MLMTTMMKSDPELSAVEGQADAEMLWTFTLEPLERMASLRGDEATCSKGCIGWPGGKRNFTRCTEIDARLITPNAEPGDRGSRRPSCKYVTLVHTWKVSAVASLRSDVKASMRPETLMRAE